MRTLVLGADGYIGWTLCLHLKAAGHEIAILDNLSRRELAGESIVPISSWRERLGVLEPHFVGAYSLDNRTTRLSNLLLDFAPQVIFHLAQMPSAPYSMRDIWSSVDSYADNVLGNLRLLWEMRLCCRDAHLIKLGTMGEYGTPAGVIPESGVHEFPRQPGSYYHSSKVADSVNCELAARCWGLRITDIMQGVVYGLRTEQVSPDDHTATRFDVDAVWGTVINRFCAQRIIGMPLTVYGTGEHIRSFLPLRESIRCLLLIAANTPAEGEYRVVNQFAETRSMNELADIVSGNGVGDVDHIENPRVEAPVHIYDVEHNKLRQLGYEPQLRMARDVDCMLEDLLPFRQRIEAKRDDLLPKVLWR